jgi:hypothetical protein
MFPLSRVSGDILSFTVPQNTLESLYRLRESYKDLLQRESLTEADQAVLMVVEITLKQIMNAQPPL